MEKIPVTSWYGKYHMFYEFAYTSQEVIAGFLNHQQYVKETNKKHLVMFSASPIAAVWGNVYIYIYI